MDLVIFMVPIEKFNVGPSVWPSMMTSFFSKSYNSSQRFLFRITDSPIFQRLRVREQHHRIQNDYICRSWSRNLSSDYVTDTCADLEIDNNHYHFWHENSVRIVHTQSMFGKYYRSNCGHWYAAACFPVSASVDFQWRM